MQTRECVLPSFPEASLGWASETKAMGDIPVSRRQFLQENCGVVAPSRGHSHFLTRPLAGRRAKNVAVSVIHVIPGKLSLLRTRLWTWLWIWPGQVPRPGLSHLGWNQKWSQSPCRGVLDPYTLESGRLWAFMARKLPPPPTPNPNHSLTHVCVSAFNPVEHQLFS